MNSAGHRAKFSIKVTQIGVGHMKDGNY